MNNVKQITTETIDLDPTADGDSVQLTKYFVDGEQVAMVKETDFQEMALLRTWNKETGIDQKSLRLPVAKAYKFAMGHALKIVEAAL